jgi:hypothetical protein
MGGKVSMCLVLGFSFIFLTLQLGFNKLASETNDNFTKYYVNEKAHYIAVSGVNMVINKLFLDATITDQTFNMRFDEGNIAATLTTLDNIKNIKRLTSAGTFFGTTNTVKVILKPSLFSKYSYFSNSEGGNIWWTASDTVWGPFHTNDYLRIANHPVFYGKATSGLRQILYDRWSSGVFYGGYQSGIQISIPTNGVACVAAQSAGGAQITGHSLVYFEFRGDSVRYKYSKNGSYTYKLASTFAPNGVISIVNAEVHLQGIVKGRFSLAVSGTSGNTGNVYLDDNLVYYSDPLTNDKSTDMLGLIVKRNVIVTDNNANRSDIIINASIYCEDGSFTAENYDDKSYSGAIRLLGGITQKTRGAVSTFSGNRIVTGYSKRYRYDERLLTTYPPNYPGCGSFEVVSWFE